MGGQSEEEQGHEIRARPVVRRQQGLHLHIISEGFMSPISGNFSSSKALAQRSLLGFSAAKLGCSAALLGCSAAQLVVRWLAVRQARVQISARHPREVPPTEPAAMKIWRRASANVLSE